MRFTPASDDEVARRKALGAELWTRKSFPPLYRVAAMDPESVLHGNFGSSSPVKTTFVFTGEESLSRPRLEVHTLERGAVDSGAPLLWLRNFRSVIPEPSRSAEPVPVRVSKSTGSGTLIAATAEGWMVSVEAPDATLLVMGPGELPSRLSLEPVDMHALKRSEFRNSGIAET
ncbi:hypothetical protein ABCS02_24890 [Microbacterium sp. X-17]|uniref:hypothetical protein n=1 Tax=Microbacterium sp. X-17 TaxID=3144404 RepID=UPI0031F51199